MKGEKFNIDVSLLRTYEEKDIKRVLNRYTKRELLEHLLQWKELANAYKSLSL
tara:strand:- start:549 stop:707 length:159 start_codon:yes stop_codon:yes gene_type:complete